MARAHMILSAVFLLLIVVQVFLAGLGVMGASDYDAHKTLGNVLEPLSLVLLAVALIGRLERPVIILSGVVLVLTILQRVWIDLRDDTPEIAAVHPVMALALFFLAHELMQRGIRAMRGAPAA